MASLSVSDASRMAGVSIESMVDKINRGELQQTEQGIDVAELIREYPNLKPLASLKIRKVKETPVKMESFENIGSSNEADSTIKIVNPVFESDNSVVGKPAMDTQESQTGTVELLVRELEWNKELLEQTNQQMAKQLADQRALIADQARRLDEKDRFWARQIEIAQSLLPAPQPVPVARKKFLGIF